LPQENLKRETFLCCTTGPHFFANKAKKEGPGKFAFSTVRIVKVPKVTSDLVMRYLSEMLHEESKKSPFTGQWEENTENLSQEIFRERRELRREFRIREERLRATALYAVRESASRKIAWSAGFKARSGMEARTTPPS
jgi:hypothetical protein